MCKNEIKKNTSKSLDKKLQYVVTVLPFTAFSGTSLDELFLNPTCHSCYLYRSRTLIVLSNDEI
jgi:hypothetical protein